MHILTIGKNMALRDELLALRDATAQSYAHAEGQKERWGDIEKAQTNLYQVCDNVTPLTLSVNDHRFCICGCDTPSPLRTTTVRSWQRRLSKAEGAERRLG